MISFLMSCSIQFHSIENINTFKLLLLETSTQITKNQSYNNSDIPSLQYHFSYSHFASSLPSSFTLIISFLSHITYNFVSCFYHPPSSSYEETKERCKFMASNCEIFHIKLNIIPSSSSFCYSFYCTSLHPSF